LPENWHPHLHVLATDGLFKDTQAFPIGGKETHCSRSYGWYSNKNRGLRAKKEHLSEDAPIDTIPDEVEVIDVSRVSAEAVLQLPKNIPSLTWRESIKKIWKADPSICSECQSEMRIILFITEGPIIHKILKHLGLWDEERDSQLRIARAPPPKTDTPEIVWIPIEDAGGNVFSLH